MAPLLQTAAPQFAAPQAAARTAAAAPHGISLSDAVALLAAGSRLHGTPDERALRAAAVWSARELLPGAVVRCAVLETATDRTSAHEVVRLTRPAAAVRLAMIVQRDPGRIDLRDVAIATVLAGQLSSAWELIRLREESRAADPAVLALLTVREREVLDLVSRGATNAETGAALGIGARTVEKHLEHVAAKLGARGRTAASAVYLGALAAVR